MILNNGELFNYVTTTIMYRKNKTMKTIITILFFLPIFCFGQWVQVGNSISGEAAGDLNGYSTAISADGSIVAMGAIFNAGNGSGAGQVRVFENISGTWIQIGADIDGETSGDQTGQGVSLSSNGTIVAIGEPYNNDLGFVSGQVRVFQNNNGTWIQKGSDLYGTMSSAAGTCVDLSSDGSILAFGAPNSDVNGISFAGLVSVYEYINNTWVQKGGDIEGDGSIIKFGSSVSLSADGNIVAIGQSGNPMALDSGKVKIYQFTSGQWVQLGNTISGTLASAEFGFEISLTSNGNMVAIGAYSQNEVRVFELVAGNWSQVGSTLSGEAIDDQFGQSVSISDAGSYLAVGARRNDANGLNAGRVYVYKNQGGNWVLLGNAMDGSMAGDQAGFSVALSASGSSVAIGAISNSSNGANAGQVRVFENSSILNTSENARYNQLRIFPNPTYDKIHINSEFEIVAYQIITSDGKTIAEELINNQQQINLSLVDLNQGIYFVKIKTANGSTIAKVSKE